MIPADPLRPGARLGRYRLLERVGAGGMAEVFAARTDGAEGFSRVVAIKVVHADASDEEHLLALIDEARVASILRHPNIVQVYELDRHGDGLYMVMEFLDGWPLDRLLKMAASQQIRASLEVVVGLGAQLLDALAYAHTAPAENGTALELVHRDIKPSNLMVDSLGLLKVVDFGIARASNIERRTATGVGKGTPAYMSPEQLYGQPVDPRSDLFAAGCVLYELATGQRLFEAAAFGPLILRRTEGFTDADRATLEEACPELARVIGKAISQDPSERWEDAASMSAALRAAHGGSRDDVQGWLADVLGGDPVSLRRKVSAVEIEPPAATDATMASGLDRTAPMPGAEPTDAAVLLEEIEPTRLVPAPRRSRLPVALGGLAVILLGVALWRLTLGPTTVPATAGDPELVLATTPEPTPAPTEDPSPADPAPSNPAPASDPAPTAPTLPDPTPRPPAPTPTPAPIAEAPPAPEPNAARGSLAITLVPSGFFSVDGGTPRSTPNTVRLTPGVHTVSLLDRENGQLGAARIRIASGQKSVCTWVLEGAQLRFTPSPFNDPCEVLP